MKVTLLVIILTLGHPSSLFSVQYDSAAECFKGIDQAHKMSIDPKSQTVKAFCLSPTALKEFNRILGISILGEPLKHWEGK